ncbi:hypothetical protein DKX38_015184 [Salix brachista]|uniref:RING-type domain-containing protein n=1 Tax=Salix brachista TaxID=2182728 RepID=A0A5N5L6C9_9ROSI|nr:hypothetical protein DKX38_015184 [Salix brachista]
MGQQQSKDELLYQQVKYSNIEGIKTLRREGAGLEWIDKEGKTPLIVACLNPQSSDVAKTLIELGANVNAYRPANALVMNDDCQTPLEVARAKGYSNVVRAIESHICLFSGWLREFNGPGFLEMLVPQLVSRKIWVAVLPTGSRNPRMPYKLELAMYSSLQDAQPRTIIALWKVNLEEPKFHRSDPTVMIVDNSTKTRIKLAPENERDKQQLQWFCDACKGIPQKYSNHNAYGLLIEVPLAMHPPEFLSKSQNLVAQATAPPSAEDEEIAMALNASIQSSMAEQPIFDNHSSTGASSSTSSCCSANAGGKGAMDAPAAPPPIATRSRWALNEAVASGSSTQQTKIRNSSVADVQTATDAQDSVPSAPPIVDELVEDGPIHYPSIDSSLIDISSLPTENLPGNKGEKKEDGGPSSCVICLDAPVEGACIPCGHMVGCMSCLKEIKDKKWGCPVCRATINQVVRLYAV